MFSIEIPLKTANEVLVVNPEDLKEDAEFLLEFLAEECIPDHIYAEISLGYWEQGMYSEFERFLKVGKDAASKAKEADSQKSYILILTMLGSYYIEAIRLLSSGHKMALGYKEEDLQLLNESAENILNEVMSIDPNDPLYFALKGNYLYMNSKLDSALSFFDKIVDYNPVCVMGLSGQASILFRRREYEKALELYQKLIQLGYKIDQDVRINMGICFYYCGMESESQEAFRRVLEIDPKNSDAALLLTATKIQAFRTSTIPENRRDELISEINESLLNAFKETPGSLLLRYLLARILLLKKDWQKTQELCESLIKSLHNDRIMHSKVLVIRAQCYQAQEMRDKALEDLEAAYSMGNRTLSLYYLLSFEYIAKSQNSKALNLLERVVNKTNAAYNPTLRYVSICLSQKYFSKGKISDLVTKIGDYQQEPVSYQGENKIILESNLLTNIAIQYESLDPEVSLKLYIRAVEKIKNLGRDASYNYYINMGALSFKLASISMRSALRGTLELPNEMLVKGLEECSFQFFSEEDFKEIDTLFLNSKYIKTYLLQAQKCYIHALNLAKKELSPDSTEYIVAEVTIIVNTALLLHAAGLSNSAYILCEKVAKEYPAYIDVRLIMAQIDIERRNFDSCFMHLKTVMSIDKNNIKSRLLLAHAHMEENQNHHEAKRAYGTILKDIDNNDVYSLCALGNLNLKFFLGAKKKEQQEAYLNRALKLFNFALTENSRCIPAALGIFIVMVENGMFERAKTVFTVLEQHTDISDSITINLAKLYLATDPHGVRISIPLCQKVRRKRDGSYNLAALEVLAKACYMIGKESKDIYYMKLALNYIQLVILMAPEYTLFFNLALIRQKIFQILNEQSKGTESVYDLEKEIEGLKVPERIFTALSKRPGALKQKYADYAELRVSFCRDVWNRARTKIEETLLLDKQRKQRLEEIKERREHLQNERSARELDESKRLNEEEERMQKEWYELQQKIIQDMKGLAANEYKPNLEENKRESVSKNKHQGKNKRVDSPRNSLEHKYRPRRRANLTMYKDDPEENEVKRQRESDD